MTCITGFPPQTNMPHPAPIILHCHLGNIVTAPPIGRAMLPTVRSGRYDQGGCYHAGMLSLTAGLPSEFSADTHHSFPLQVVLTDITLRMEILEISHRGQEAWRFMPVLAFNSKPDAQYVSSDLPQAFRRIKHGASCV